MGAFDPVHWETRVAAIGPPAREIEAYVDRLGDEVAEADPYDAVKAIHDAIDGSDVERTVPGLGEVFVTAYLLEKRGAIDPDASDEYPSLVDRKPDGDRLEELFRERERTLWWIGIVAGVHPSLVTYWLYEEGIPLMERNYTDESLAAIRDHRESSSG